MSDLSDIEWIAEVRKYAVNFGGYNFSLKEIERMRPYVVHIPATKGVIRWSVRLKGVFDLMDQMEHGITDAVTRKLTQ